MKEHIKGPDISAFLDGALSAEDRARAAGHLSACSVCRAELDSLRRMKATLSAAPRKAMPADLALALERRLVDSQSHWWAGAMRPAVWVPTGTIAAAALLVGFWLHAGSTTEEIPLGPLLEAHSRYNAETLVPEDNLAASTYSDQFTTLYADNTDAAAE